MDISSLSTFNLQITKQAPHQIQVSFSCHVLESAGDLHAVWPRLRADILGDQSVAGFVLADPKHEQASLQIDARRTILASFTLTKAKA